MGQVVRLKQHASMHEYCVSKHTFELLQRKLERQKKTIAELRARNKHLVKLLQDPFDDIARLRRELMRMQDEVNDRLHGRCTCTPDRSDFLRAIARG